MSILPNPVFLLQIVENEPRHLVARLPAGGELESDLIEQITRAVLARLSTVDADFHEQTVGGIMAKAVGFGPSANAKHESDVRAALKETAPDRMVYYNRAIQDGVKEAIMNLKTQTKFLI